MVIVDKRQRLKLLCGCRHTYVFKYYKQYTRTFIKMLSHIKKILEDMGWTDGYHIPVANKENLALEAEVERLTLAKAKATVAFDAISSKCSALEKHLKNVITEQEQNQTLLLARDSELNAERDLYMLTKMEKEQMAAEVKSFQKEYEKVEDRKQNKLKDLNNLVSKLDKLKASIEWDEHTIDDWEDQLTKKTEDNDIIKKFSQEDKKKFKDLEIKRQRLQEEYTARKDLVIKTTKETDSLQLILTRNVQLYKQMHEERGTLVKQWQDAVKNLQQRDKDTLTVNREIIATKELIEAKQEILDQEKQFHQNEVNNNAELEVQIEQGNFDVAKLRKDIQNNTRILADYTMEYETMKRELKKTADILESERIATKKLFNDLLQREKELHNVNLKVQHLKVQENNVRDSKWTSSERVKQLEELIRTEEIIYKGLRSDLENMQIAIFTSQKTINELEEFHKLKVIAAQGSEQGITVLEKEKVLLDKEIIDQKEQNYKIDFKLAMLMSKITRMEGARADDFDEENERKFMELEVKSKEVIELGILLQAQVNRLEDLMRNLSNTINSNYNKVAKLKDLVQEQMLLVDGAEKLLQTKKNLHNQHQVEENVLKVRLKHAEKQLQNEGNIIYNLERQQLELETMMKERESEIGINKNILIAKRNALQDDNSRMRQDIQGRKMKTENLKKRLDCVMASLGKSEDGTTFSVAYFKVKNAQEKFMMQEEGDKLDNLIRNAEKEIIAMENTLKAVNFANDAVRKSLAIVEEEDEEITEMKEIEDDLYAQTKLLRQNRNQLVAQQEKLRQIQEILDIKREKVDELQKQISEKQGEYDLLENEALHRKTKIDRTDKLIKKVVTGKKEINEVQERDFFTRQLQDFNRSALQQLSETSVRYLETKPTINHYLSENKLSLSVTSLRSSTKSYSSLSYSSSTIRSVASIPSISLALDVPK